jgi:hypothetical protein
MPKNLTAAALVGLFISGTAMAQSWLCVGDQSAGFTYEKGKWRPVIFNGVSAFKIVIRVPTAEDKEFLTRPNILSDENPTWLAVPLGEEFPTMACRANGNPAFINCEGAIQELRFNRSSLRFQYTYRPGYIDTKPGSDQSGDDPKMVIGLCSAI